MEQSFENIKVGDYVIFSTGGWYGSEYICEVSKVTPKQFEAKGYRFRKTDGAMIGDTYNYCRYATEQDFKRLKMEKYRNSLRNKIRQFFHSCDNTNLLTIEEMETIAKIISNKQKQ